MAKFKEYQQEQVMLLPPSLGDLIGKNHIARLISQIIDELDFSEIEDSYSEIGCRGYHPKMLTKLLLYGGSGKYVKTL